MLDQATWTAASKAAWAVLRDPSHFHWSAITLLSLVAYVYFVEAHRRNWDLLLAAGGTWALELLSEAVNALILPLSGHAPLWTVAGDSALVLFVGLNVEISLMFAVAYVGFPKLLPEDRSLRIFGLPNRWFIACVCAVVCAAVEVLLNAMGVLVWDWALWGWPHIWSVFLFAYLPSVAFLFWLYDLPDRRRKTQIVVGLAVADAVSVGGLVAAGLI